MGSGAASDTAPVVAAGPGAAASDVATTGGAVAPAAARSGAADATANANAPPHKLQLVGYDNFKRHNPRSDRFGVHRFHHIEFWCADATNTYKR